MISLRHMAKLAKFAICALALTLVLRTVTLADRVALRDQTVLSGTLVPYGADYQLVEAGGAKREIAASQIALGADGARLVSFGLASVWRNCEKGWLLAAIGIFLGVPLLQAFRLHCLLSAQGVKLNARESVRLAFAGNFMNFAAPLGSTAGDLYKAWYVAGRTERRVEAAATVFFDRIIGLLVLLASVVLIAMFSPSDGRFQPIRAHLLSLSALTAIAGALVLLPSIRQIPLVRGLVERLPQRARLTRVHRTARELLLAPRLALLAVASTIALQILAAASFLCCALALKFTLEPHDFTSLYAYFSAGEIVKAIPGPPQGLGTMELTYRWFFADWAGASQILCAAMMIRLVNLACALPGVWTAVQWNAASAVERVTGVELEPDDARAARGSRNVALSG